MIFKYLAKTKWLLGWLLLTSSVALVSYWLVKPDQPVLRQPELALSELINCQQIGFSKVAAGYQYRFPADHLSHEGFCSEVWSFNGHFTDSGNSANQFSFQFSIARLALAAEKPELDSAWATQQIYRAHFAVADARQQTLYTGEKFSRAALALAGAKAEPGKIWVENWMIEMTKADLQPVFEIAVKQKDIAINLRLQASKPVLTVDDSSILVNTAFHAYILPRMQVTGELVLPDNKGVIQVEGQAWLDRAWGDINVGQGQGRGQGQLGLNRFILQLDDASELLLIQVRRLDGSGVPINTALLIDSENNIQMFERRDITLETLVKWESPVTGKRYPVEWRLSIPLAQLELRIEPLIENQELPLSLQYWSGGVRFAGRSEGKPSAGAGHMELSAYE